MGASGWEVSLEEMLRPCVRAARRSIWRLGYCAHPLDDAPPGNLSPFIGHSEPPSQCVCKRVSWQYLPRPPAALRHSPISPHTSNVRYRCTGKLAARACFTIAIIRSIRFLSRRRRAVSARERTRTAQHRDAGQVGEVEDEARRGGGKTGRSCSIRDG